MAIRVAIVDDHPAIREGTASLLNREPDITVVRTVGTVDEGIALLEGDPPPDVILLDVRLGEDSGMRVLTAPTPKGRKGIRPSVIVWTGYDFPQYTAFAHRSGAAGFVLKTAPTADLVDAIRRVANGGMVFDTRPDRHTPQLTDRERDILARLVIGRSNDEIGSDLGITTRTVEAHMSRLFERLDVTSRTELATKVVREGWLELPRG
jgi:DNA-binding NarL/FixJ family response regulator